jgi:hypothetical protein
MLDEQKMILKSTKQDRLNYLKQEELFKKELELAKQRNQTLRD